MRRKESSVKRYKMLAQEYLEKHRYAKARDLAKYINQHVKKTQTLTSCEIAYYLKTDPTFEKIKTAHAAIWKLRN